MVSFRHSQSPVEHRLPGPVFPFTSSAGLPNESSPVRSPDPQNIAIFRRKANSFGYERSQPQSPIHPSPTGLSKEKLVISAPRRRSSHAREPSADSRHGHSTPPSAKSVFSVWHSHSTSESLLSSSLPASRSSLQRPDTACNVGRSSALPDIPEQKQTFENGASGAVLAGNVSSTLLQTDSIKPGIHFPTAKPDGSCDSVSSANENLADTRQAEPYYDDDTEAMNVDEVIVVEKTDSLFDAKDCEMKPVKSTKQSANRAQEEEFFWGVLTAAKNKKKKHKSAIKTSKQLHGAESYSTSQQQGPQGEPSLDAGLNKNLKTLCSQKSKSLILESPSQTEQASKANVTNSGVASPKPETFVSCAPTRPARTRGRPHGAQAQATEADARKYRIPTGYSLKHWDPKEEPILLLGSVFDANSLGKWIYDWTVHHHGPSSPIAKMAGDLWLLFIRVFSEMKRLEASYPRVMSRDDREMLDDFIQSGDRLADKLRKLLKRCEKPMLEAGKKNKMLGTNAGTAFVEAMYGREQQLDKTERLMTSLRLWVLRFDANCEEILTKSSTVRAPAKSEGEREPYFLSSPTPNRESTSPENTMGQHNDDTTSEYSYISDGPVDELLEDGHPFLNELPLLVNLVLKEFSNWRSRQETSTREEPNETHHVIKGAGSSYRSQQVKRTRTTDDGAGSGDEGTKDGKRAKMGDKGERTLSLGCPYYKKDALKHRDCLRYELKRIKDVKQHLCRRHMQPHFCPLCGSEFSTQSEEKDHIRNQRCSIRDFTEPEGITEDQKAMFSTRVGRTMTLEQQWYAVWDIVFAGAKHPSSVYVQGPVVENLLGFRDFFGQHGEAMIAEQLRSRELPYNMLNEERDLSSLLAMTAAGVVNTLIEQYTNSPSSEVSDDLAPPQPTLFEHVATPLTDEHYTLDSRKRASQITGLVAPLPTPEPSFSSSDTDPRAGLAAPTSTDNIDYELIWNLPEQSTPSGDTSGYLFDQLSEHIES